MMMPKKPHNTVANMHASNTKVTFYIGLGVVVSDKVYLV
ncbi:hypothetical protein RintRC_0112 [Richelia intracellularis]|nr:hypothetical protein RintRC_0112 [Richelia intracellularis]